MKEMALLAGMVIAPTLSLILAHRFRYRTLRARRVFWYGLMGWGGGLVVTVLAMIVPALQWSGGDLRTALVYGAATGGFILGSGFGLLVPARADAS